MLREKVKQHQGQPEEATHRAHSDADAKGQPFSYRCAQCWLRRPNSAKVLAKKPQPSNQTTQYALLVRSLVYNCNASQKNVIRKMLKNTQLLNTYMYVRCIWRYLQSYTDARCTQRRRGLWCHST
jgi:hypothetical protein